MATFGKTTIGILNDNFGGALIALAKLTIPSDCRSIQSITIYLNGLGNVIPVIYEDISGIPTNLLELGQPFQVNGENFYTIPLPTTAYLYPDRSYWFGIMSDVDLRLFFDNSTLNNFCWDNHHIYPTIPDPFENPKFQTWEISLSATYEPSNEPPPPPPPPPPPSEVPPNGLGIAFTTTLRMNSPAQSGTTMIKVHGQNGKTARICGLNLIGFRESAPPYVGYDGIIIDDVINFIIDYCRTSDFGFDGVFIWGLKSQGLIHHCEFWNMMKGTTFDDMIHIGYGVGVDRNYTPSLTPWESLGEILGRYKENVFVEDCFFSGCRHSVTIFAGGIAVLRHSISTDLWSLYYSGHFDCHGAYENGALGGRAFEVYENKFFNPSTNLFYSSMQREAVACRLRGGGGLIYNNTIFDFNSAINFSGDSGNDTYPQCRPNEIHIYDNLLSNTPILTQTEGYPIGNYYLSPPSNYTAYPYPHPLQNQPIKAGYIAIAASGKINDVKAAIMEVQNSILHEGNVIIPEGDFADDYNSSNFIEYNAGIDLYGARMWFLLGGGSIQPPTPPLPSGSAAIGGYVFGGYEGTLPPVLCRLLWKLRQKYIRPEVHRKIHPLI